jgi:crotonobetainyl-CoA:carnitine CoA-transferase CaiB-like acyl-CoA transferase
VTIMPMAGLRVLDLTAMPPGGYCTVQLVDLGAEVIRVESPSLAGRPSTVIGQIGLSRGKHSMTLDQRSPQAGEVLRRLAASADVLVENAKPGAMDARGFGYSQAKVEVPRLIWCSISGFGQTGPYADRSGHDLSFAGYSGLLAALEPQLPWHPGTMLSVPLGAMVATTAILAALLERARTGMGCQVDVSISESATWLLSGMSGAFKDGFTGMGAPPERRLYRCGDGRYISVAAAEPRTWKALCDGIGAPDLVTEPGPPAQLSARLEATFAAKPAAHWVELLGPLGATVSPVHQGPDLLADPQVQARESIVQVQGEPVPVNPIRLIGADGDTSTTVLEPPSLVGADTDEVLLSVGYGADEIAALRTDQVI